MPRKNYSVLFCVSFVFEIQCYDNLAEAGVDGSSHSKSAIPQTIPAMTSGIRHLLLMQNATQLQITSTNWHHQFLTFKYKLHLWFERERQEDKEGFSLNIQHRFFVLGQILVKDSIIPPSARLAVWWAEINNAWTPDPGLWSLAPSQTRAPAHTR